MNSDLTPVQNAGTTDNPQQPTTASPGASDSASFQQSAGNDVLSQYRSLSVQETGKPIIGVSASPNSSAMLWVVIVSSMIALVVAATIIFKWIVKHPEPEIVIEDKPVVAPKSKKSKKSSKKTSGKKKTTRSKRKTR